MKYLGRCLACLAVLVLLAGGIADAHPRFGVSVVVPVGGANVVLSGRTACSPSYPYGYPSPYSYPVDNCGTYYGASPWNTYPVYSYPSYPVYSYPVYRGYGRGHWHHRGGGRFHRW